MQSLSVPSQTAPAPPAETAVDLLEASLSQTPVVEPILETPSEANVTEPASLQPIDTRIEASEEVPVWKLNLQVFTSTFFTIFLAELGDKTQVTTLLMAAESHSPWIVFAGAGAALVATSAIGCWLGCWLAKRVSPQLLERSVGMLLLFVSALLLCDVIRG